jgi:hypothetical protein
MSNERFKEGDYLDVVNDENVGPEREILDEEVLAIANAAYALCRDEVDAAAGKLGQIMAHIEVDYATGMDDGWILENDDADILGQAATFPAALFAAAKTNPTERDSND